MQRFGRFALIRPIASGGMADVWLALRKPPVGSAQLVVIKRIVPERVGDPRFIELFVQEGRLSTQLEHPNVVRTVEMGLADGQYYLALEFLRGQTVLALLTRATERKKFLPIEIILRIATDVATGLAYAHAARDRFGQPMGLVHRDISPSNLFIEYDGTAKVLDFGIARAGQAAAGRAAVKGKLPYGSPEQASGEPVDARSDLFSMGIVLHEMITLRPLFRGKDDKETVRRVLEMPLSSPSSFRRSCPAPLDDLVGRLLQRDPDRRPASADELLMLIGDTTRRLGIEPKAEHVAEFMRSTFPDEYAAAVALSPDRVAAARPARITRLAARSHRASGSPPGTARRRTEVTPAPV